ncbi:MAG: tyrosine-type recombinase/integrase [Verrucomicrobia bacterium]|nr:tyrosine-type recombinase/integrase [Verrucomicrobiota bacterium]
MKAPKVKPFKADSMPGYKWAVWFTDEDGKRTRRLFKTKSAANAFSDDMEVKAGNLGHAKAAALTTALQDEAVKCQRLLAPFGKTLTDATEHFIRHLKATEKSAPIAELVERFLDVQRAAKKSPHYLHELKNRLGMFAEDHGATYASEMDTGTIDQWISARPVGDRTKNHFRRVLSAFFKWALVQKACTTNPAREATKIKIVQGRPEIYTPAQSATILRMAAAWEGPQDILACVLLGMFAGLRPFEAQRLTWKQILRRGDVWRIDLSAAGTKTAQRRLVDVQEPLRSWMERFFTFTNDGPIVQPNFWKRTRAFRQELAKAGVPWINDGLRHSFASYSLARSSDAAAVARALGHGTTEMLFAHYAEITTPEDAKAFFALTPAAVCDKKKIVQFA